MKATQQITVAKLHRMRVDVNDQQQWVSGFFDYEKHISERCPTSLLQPYAMLLKKGNKVSIENPGWIGGEMSASQPYHFTHMTACVSHTDYRR